MSYLVIEISVDLAISDLNASSNMADKGTESVQGVINLLQALESGNKSGSVKIVSKDAATTINTSGTGSASRTFSF